MGASASVGRVGALALALGVGAIGLGAGVAWSDPADPATPSPDSVTPSSAPATVGPRSHTGRPVTSADAATRGSARGAPTPEPRPGRSATAPALPVLSAKLPVLTDTMVRAVPARALPSVAVPAAPAVAPVVVPRRDPPAVAVAAASGAAVASANPAQVAGSVSAPLLDWTSGTGPAAEPLAWVMVGAARRQLGRARRVSGPAASVTTGQAATASAIASVTARASSGSVFGNVTPTLRPQQVSQAVTGVVTGLLNAVDPDSATLKFSVTQNPLRGIVTVSANGTYTYTPGAAYVRTGTTDTFKVSVSDAGSGFHVHGLGGLLNLLTFGLLGGSGHAAVATVKVTVAPHNVAPTGTLTVGSPDPTSGLVTGSVTATDADGDLLSYSGSASTAKGAVVVGSDGSFTYTPTVTARHNAASVSATTGDKTDSFTITVSDGFGGSVVVPVGVAVAPANVAPGATGSAGVPNGSTGVVTGSVSASDADSDLLSYSGSGVTSKGAVVVAANGSFTYTPTALARHNAAAVGATDADRADAFTVTVSDGHGGSVAVPIAVVVSSKNSVPTGSAAAGMPEVSSGVVTGAVTAVDGDGDLLSYSGSASTAKGAVVVASDGSFTYTPTVTARHNAAAVVAGVADKADSFSVTVADGHGGTLVVPVSVVVSPVNDAPVGDAPTVGSPNGSTGVVTGAVTAVDGDSDLLSYSGSASTAKGAVVVGSDGSFTYTPTVTARHNAASVSATTGDKTDSFTITVSDGHGGTVAVPVSVAVSPRNNAPSGTPVVGVASTSTGVVTGSLTTSDSDGDPLTFSGSTTTAKGTVVVSANGSFTYTPTAIARHNASLTTAAAGDLTDSFTITVNDGHGGVVDIPVNVAVSPAGISFTFNYGTGSQLWSADARTALQAAANTLASYILAPAPVTLTLTITGENAPTSPFLATASAVFTSSSPGFYGTLVQKKILTGVDSNGTTADSTILWNFGYPWALGDTVGNTKYDFQAVAIHELMHTFGFLSGVGATTSPDRNWTTFDSFLATSNGTDPINADYTWNTTYTTNFTGGNGGLYFAGPNAVDVYGGLVPLYTPSTWTDGSSVSHLNPNNVGADTQLMNPSSPKGPGVRALSPLELAILKDLGYTVVPDPTAPVLALVIVGFRIRRRRI